MNCRLLRWASVFLAIGPGVLGRPAHEDTDSSAGNASVPFARLMGRQDDSEPGDLDWITRMASIGDSYAAGIGAGERLGSVAQALIPQSDFACSRYDHSYPYLLNNDSRLGDPSQRDFQFRACSGAVTEDVIEKQIPELSNNQQVITLSIGGNDAELTNVLNHCVFQWLSFGEDQRLVVEEVLDDPDAWWYDTLNVESMKRSCDDQLDHTEEILESYAFSNNLDAVLEAAKEKLAPDGQLYYTGYAKFFDEDLTSDCNNVTWATLLATANFFNEYQYLTVERRQRMNDLVEIINEKLSDAVSRAGSSVVFVDYDHYVGRFNGRFCEPGVDEAAEEARSRPGLMFYEFHSLDPFGTNPYKRSTHEELVDTFIGEVNLFAEVAVHLDPEARYVGWDQEDAEAAVSVVAKLDAGVHADAGTDAAAAAEFVSSAGVSISLVPDGYGRVFHPQTTLHQIIAGLIIYHMVNDELEREGYDRGEEISSIDMCLWQPIEGNYLSYKDTSPGEEVKPGTTLRILCVGDSITYGSGSELDGGDGNGYRLKLRDNLSEDKVEFVGSESAGDMSNNLMAAWPGRTIKYISDRLDSSLRQGPNIVLIHAGTNDMDSRPNRSVDGNDPEGVAERLGDLIDQVLETNPDAVVLVAMIIGTCDPHKAERTPLYQSLIPGVVKERRDQGEHVLAVDFTSFRDPDLYDCIHPSNEAYREMGDYWYDFITQIPSNWIKDPVVNDDDFDSESTKNGGISTSIPRPNRGEYPIKPSDTSSVRSAWEKANYHQRYSCRSVPEWSETGQIAVGVGSTGDWQFELDWRDAGQVADGIRKPGSEIRLVDMDGDGRADYVWLDPMGGEMICWLNNLHNGSPRWIKAGDNDEGVIADGTGAPAKQVYLADANGDGLTDYLVVNPDTGAVNIWWNRGPDSGANNGWKWESGGRIAVGATHANLATLRFPDINGDGRADYVFIGEGGALENWMNTGQQGGTEVTWEGRGGIATGQTNNFTRLVLADIDGDGRDDYLIWDDEGGLTGYLNQPSNKEGSPMWIDQGPAKTLAHGTNLDFRSTFLVDMDGDGKVDYAHVDSEGRVFLWYNRGTTDNHMAIDGIRFADINGDGIDDFIWLDPDTGAPYAHINRGYRSSGTNFGWLWEPINDGDNMAAGAAPASQVIFADINGDGMDDYLVVSPERGAIEGYLNEGRAKSQYGWRFKHIGQVARGGSDFNGAHVRLADLNGDGYADYISLGPRGVGIVYLNEWNEDSPADSWVRASDLDPGGIGQRPEEVSFHDINGDGRADYVWTNPLNGSASVWGNQWSHHDDRVWQGPKYLAGGVGTSGQNVRYARLQATRRASYVAVDRETGAMAAWLNGCGENSVDVPRSEHVLTFEASTSSRSADQGGGTLRQWLVKQHDMRDEHLESHCTSHSRLAHREERALGRIYPGELEFDAYDTNCTYEGTRSKIGSLSCDGAGRIRCWEDPAFGEDYSCGRTTYTPRFYCELPLR